MVPARVFELVGFRLGPEHVAQLARAIGDLSIRRRHLALKIGQHDREMSRMRMHAFPAYAHSGAAGELEHAQLVVLQRDAIAARHHFRRVLCVRFTDRELSAEAAQPRQQKLSPGFA
jgi:hypothetical protein